VIEVGKLDGRLIRLLAIAVPLMLILRFVVFTDKAPAVVAATESVPMAEKRLEKLRELAAMGPGRETVLKQVRGELETRERGILQAETSAQAQAQLMDVIHRVAAANGFDARGAEQLGEAKPLGSDYGEVTVTETFNCAIEQFVNFMAALANEPQIVATNDIHITGGRDKNKNIQVRLSLSGVVPRKLVPVKKGARY
jgi:hypothetical protein